MIQLVLFKLLVPFGQSPVVHKTCSTDMLFKHSFLSLIWVHSDFMGSVIHSIPLITWI